MVSFRGQKKAWATSKLVSYRGLIQNFRRASPPLSYAESPPRAAFWGCYRGISNNASKAVSERLLKLHGRWKTDEAKDMYVLETECNRLSVTKYLGI